MRLQITLYRLLLILVGITLFPVILLLFAAHDAFVWVIEEVSAFNRIFWECWDRAERRWEK